MSASRAVPSDKNSMECACTNDILFLSDDSAKHGHRENLWFSICTAAYDIIS